jgi:stage V sporulation protein R
MWRDHLGELRRAATDAGLRPRDTEFVEVPAEELYALAAMRVPGMYHHWSFGRNYEVERTRHDRGRGTVYELVCNLDPARAYLLDQNSEAEHVFVAAHVLGHVDLFGRNCFCRQQRPDMDRVLNAARPRFAEYEREHGAAAVEAVLDAAHGVMWHSTPVTLAGPREIPDPPPDPYRGLFGPAADADRDRARYREDRMRHRRGIGERDLLRFLIAQAPLDPWQADVLGVVREVALYLAPQVRTKILHEGWASFWHRRLLRSIRAYPDSDVQDARLHAAVVGEAGGGRNPYWLGLTLLEHLQARGTDVLTLGCEESDRSLLERIDEEVVAAEPALRTLAEALAARAEAEAGPGRRREPVAPWTLVRAAFVDALPALPEVEVAVREWDGRRLVLEAAVAVDEAYARRVLAGLAALWGGQVVLVTPAQELASPRAAG